MGFEPTTPTLARLCSTPELHPLVRETTSASGYIAEAAPECNREIREIHPLPENSFSMARKGLSAWEWDRQQPCFASPVQAKPQ